MLETPKFEYPQRKLGVLASQYRSLQRQALLLLLNPDHHPWKPWATHKLCLLSTHRNQLQSTVWAPPAAGLEKSGSSLLFISAPSLDENCLTWLPHMLPNSLPNHCISCLTSRMAVGRRSLEAPAFESCRKGAFYGWSHKKYKNHECL